ncbi:hypothetical protein EDEG_04046 [Edhazardia aedis USNM 41457]|uniref:Translation initiation factor 5A-like N-terminal domain-containing protein n=1 Tax=Edhazardia aedis (strain USNM 41457) TaxID=1003232 RepID=J9DF58_EDHAE|nr:hypothetical protein EDEG_04046 [Edhazardia aedis USNM 41457]|eukprot:EJW01235.1 hypothetical protein EDEG_04046 [Edhazardia aedis USNM 41457]
MLLHQDQVVKTGDLVSAGSLKEGQVILNEIPPNGWEYVKIVKTSKCKTGKHGSAKVMLEGRNVVTHANRKIVKTSGENVQVINFVRIAYEVTDALPEDGFIFVRPYGVDTFDVQFDLNRIRTDEDRVEILKRWRDFNTCPIENRKDEILVLKLVFWQDGSVDLDKQ